MALVTTGHETGVTLLTSDKVRLNGLLLGPRTPSAHPTAVVVAHGFTKHTGRPDVRRLLRRLALRHTVLGLDLRGHGRSGGRSSVGLDEQFDVAAGVEFLRALGHPRVTTLGCSLGGSVVLRQAALAEGAAKPDAVVAVSPPARWWVRETTKMRRVNQLLELPGGPAFGLLMLGVRLGPRWTTAPASPIELAPRIAPTPLLFVHGTADNYFPVADVTAMHRACGPSAELWLEEGMGHAESSLTPGLVDRIREWLGATSGSVPSSLELTTSDFRNGSV
ncbi:alpha/beta hydrolase [Crossiella cryophila]|uniref:Pimeloyl-ACP methyl ester carboxylesterase n=1 Tax=Crossiella cryophila TaxID=43355 RepID=A0A7W7C531_9PSEU|nr:alpha/beta fold hydrolase [Crossiella cryophila]MBB4674639.1 pimeloyl-ACP methyl ester carboxylesterase [Crossiella cryophila]